MSTHRSGPQRDDKVYSPQPITRGGYTRSVRHGMKAFPRTSGPIFRSIKIRTEQGKYVKRGTSTTDLPTADRMAAMADVCAKKHAWEVITPIADGERSVADVFAIWATTPARFSERTKRPMEPSDDDRIEHVRAMFARVESKLLTDLLVSWPNDKIAPPKRRYAEQVEKFLAGRALTVDDYTTEAIGDHVLALNVTPVTAKKYLAAHRAFGRYLVRQKLVKLNPARVVDVFKDLPKVDIGEPDYLAEGDVKRLVLALDGKWRALEALMAGTSLEWGACMSITPENVDLDNRVIDVFQRGDASGKPLKGKNRWRRRSVDFTEDWAWEIFAGYVKLCLPGTAIFASTDHRTALEKHYAASDQLDLPRTTLHDHRHSYAVMWIKRGAFTGIIPHRSKQWLKTQFGHSPSSLMIDLIYGVFVDGAAKRLIAQGKRAAGPKLVKEA